MIIIPGILGEAELMYFEEDDYLALKKLINVYLARILHEYCNNPDADEVYVSMIRLYLGSTIDGIINNDKLVSKELKQTVFGISAQDIRDLADNKALCDTITDVENILNTCTSILNPRNNVDFENFQRRFYRILMQMAADGVPTTYENPVAVFKANSKVLYQPHEKTLYLASYLYLKHQSSWFSAKRGIDWMDYTSQHDISERMRL